MWCSISMPIHQLPQQAGLTNSLNCPVGQCKSPAAASPRFLSLSHRCRREQHIRMTLTLQRRLPRQALLPFLISCTTASGAPGGWPKAVKGALAKQNSVNCMSCTAICKKSFSNLPALPSTLSRGQSAPPLSYLLDHDAGQGTWYCPCERGESEMTEARYPAQGIAEWKP